MDEVRERSEGLLHRRITRQTRWSRTLSIGLAVLVIVSNLLWLGLLIAELSNNAPNGENLLVGAMQIWVTNVIGFALLFWEMDRGGPVARRNVPRVNMPAADWRFSQDENQDAVPEVSRSSSEVSGWVPVFVDFLYLSVTNSSAFFTRAPRPPYGGPSEGRTGADLPGPARRVADILNKPRVMSAKLPLHEEMAHIAASAGSVEQRAEALLGCLRGVIPYAAAWIGVRDPETRMHHRVGSDGDTDSLVRYFALPEADDEVERLGLNRLQPPVPASALGVPLAETRAWGEYLLPAGFDDGVAMALFTQDGRHLGFFCLLTGDRAHRTPSYSWLLAGLRPTIAQALDRLPSFAAAAHLTDDAAAGIVITRRGRPVPVPGLPTHPLLAQGSPTLAVARRYAAAPGTSATFLSPWARTFVRISVLDFRDDVADHLSALVLVRPGGDAAHLELSDLRLLGALVEGWDDERIRSIMGLSDPSRSAARLAHELGLSAPGDLVQHAARRGLHLPPSLW